MNGTILRYGTISNSDAESRCGCARQTNYNRFTCVESWVTTRRWGWILSSCHHLEAEVVSLHALPSHLSILSNRHHTARPSYSTALMVGLMYSVSTIDAMVVSGELDGFAAVFVVVVLS